MEYLSGGKPRFRSEKRAFKKPSYPHDFQWTTRPRTPHTSPAMSSASTHFDPVVHTAHTNPMASPKSPRVRVNIVHYPRKVAPNSRCGTPGLSSQAKRGSPQALDPITRRMLGREISSQSLGEREGTTGQGDTVSLRSAGRFGWPSDFISRKQAKSREFNAGNRTITLERFSSKLSEVSLDVSTLKLHN